MLSDISPGNDNNQDPVKIIRSPWSMRCELGIAVIIISAVITWSLWSFLNVSNSNYPYTTDGMGHLTRIAYIADCFKQLQWPSWFPFWYNGSTVMQYYPPLSFLLLAIVQMVTDNIMITFKCTVFLAQLIGSVGVWYFCYRFIGPRIGIIGGILYAIQPFLLRSLLCAGEIAQIPIFALTPWLLCYSFLLFEKRTPARWLAICLIGSLLILSQPMHAFLISVCMGIVILVLLITRNSTLSDCIYWVLAIGLGAGLGAFWSFPGVTSIENPGIPYMLPEASSVYASTYSFFDLTSRNSGGFYVGISLILFSLGSITKIRKNKFVLPLFMAMLIGIYLSFGEAAPFYKYIPMHQSFVPRRFLSFSVLAAIVLNVYCLSQIIIRFKLGSHLGKIFFLLGFVLIIFVIGLDSNPHTIITETDSFSTYQKQLDQLSVADNPFNQGRFAWLCPTASEVAYFPMTRNLNMTDGWSIEGTPHNRAIWLHNIAIAEKCNDYIIRNLLLWNTRSVCISSQYTELRDLLLQYGFHLVDNGSQAYGPMLFNPSPSSYCMRQERNAIAIGLAAPKLVMNFPWFVQGKSASLEDYTQSYLQPFNLIYLIEPEVKDFGKFQNSVSKLADSGKVVIVSMGRSKTWPLFDIIPYWENVAEGSELVPAPGSPFSNKIPLEADPNGQAPVMGNLDAVWMEMHAGNKHAPVIGYKSVGTNRVYFVGLAMDQLLNSGHGPEIKALLEQIMDIGHPNKNIIPVAFPVSDAKWGHDNFNFSYDSKQPVSIIVSVTYTPRWKGQIDNSLLEVKQLDNLILLDLPAGRHRVTMNYGMTWVGWAGVALSLLSFILVILIYHNQEHLDSLFISLKSQLKRAVEGLSS